MGLQPALIGFVATVIGGMGSLVGAVAGGFALGVLSVVFQAYLPDSLTPYSEAFVFTLVILFLVVRPAGLFGARLTEERV
jgi:branched-chain amino acid transport system permease protein